MLALETATIVDDDAEPSYWADEADTMPNLVTAYLQEASRARLLTAAEERELSSRARVGDLTARDRMMAANLRLVVSVARRYLNRGLPLMDLVQEGNLGLLRAIEKYEPERGWRFSTYAVWWIRQAVTRAVEDDGRLIRIPVHAHEARRATMHAWNALTCALEREPTVAEIVTATGLTERAVRQSLALPTVTMPLDAPVGESDGTLAEIIPDQAEAGMDAHTERLDTTDRLHAAMSDLTARDREVLARRFGLGEHREHTLDEIGRALGITRERARQIEAVALRRLRTSRALRCTAEEGCP